MNQMMVEVIGAVQRKERGKNYKQQQKEIFSLISPLRFRSSPITAQSPNKKQNSTLDDDGSICPICLDTWEMSGDHRLTSLKCGHLFGHSCIKR